MKKLICPECGNVMLNPIRKKGIITTIVNCIRFHEPDKKKALKQLIKLAKEHKIQQKGWCSFCSGWRQAV